MEAIERKIYEHFVRSEVSVHSSWIVRCYPRRRVKNADVMDVYIHCRSHEYLDSEIIACDMMAVNNSMH